MNSHPLGFGFCASRPLEHISVLTSPDKNLLYGPGYKFLVVEGRADFYLFR